MEMSNEIQEMINENLVHLATTSGDGIPNVVLESIPKISSDPLEKMIKGCDGSRILLTALDFDLFDLLEGSKTAEEISTGIGNKEV